MSKAMRYIVSLIALGTTLVGVTPSLLGPAASAAPAATQRARGGSCPQWHDLAISVGWSEADYARISPIMWRESRCTPTAINRRSGDYGLIQAHYKIWGPRCGMSRAELLDPTNNLTCGLTILNTQGWRAWGVRR